MLFEVHRVYDGEGDFRRCGEILDDYHWFFKLQAHANRFAALVYMVGLLTPDRPGGPVERRTINLPDLIGELESDGKIDVATADMLRAKLDEGRKALKGIRLVRNKALSHRDAAIDLNEAFRRAKISAVEIRKLSDNAIDVANALSGKLGLREVVANVDDLKRDARRLFEKLGAEFPPAPPNEPWDTLFKGT